MTADESATRERFRRLVSETAPGLTVEALEWEEADGGYWVMRFTNGTELCFSRTMAELARGW